MKTEHPILFNREMVLANLAGKKTQTRRLVTPRNSTVNGYPFDKHCAWPWHMLDWDKAEFRPASIWGAGDCHFSVPLMGEDGKPEKDPDNITRHRVRPRWSVGDVLWGKETFGYKDTFPVGQQDGKPCSRRWLRYKADDPTDIGPLKPSIFMRRWMSRLILEITDLRGQRLQEISEGDALAEGVDTIAEDYYSKTGEALPKAYRRLWESINAKKAPWANNPLVWAVTYKPA